MYVGSWKIDDLLTVTVNTHDPTLAGAPEADADSVPSYRVYEDETGTAMLTGSMAKLDDANTTGFYSEQIALSAATGFEKGKTYSIRITATVSGVIGSTIRTFQIQAEVSVASHSTTAKSEINAEVVDCLNVDTYAEPGQEAPPATTTLVKKIGYCYKLKRNRKTQTATQFSLFADNGTTIDQKATVSDDTTTFDFAELVTGP